jgi:small conductance mechanosensitive channel
MSTESLKSLFGRLQELGAEFGLRVIAAIAIFLVGRWVAALMQQFVSTLMVKARVEPSLISFTGNLVYYGIIAFVVLAALGQLGIETSSLIAMLGAAGLAIGLALQGSLSNFAAGILLVIFHPFRVGDWIEGAGVSGFVEEIQLLTTVLRTLDNKTVTIPNSSLTSQNIVNYSTKGILRIDLVIGIDYDEEIDRVKQVIAAVLAEDERILKSPAPTVGVLALADNAVNLAVRPWVHTENYWPVYSGFRLSEVQSR